MSVLTILLLMYFIPLVAVLVLCKLRKDSFGAEGAFVPLWNIGTFLAILIIILDKCSKPEVFKKLTNWLEK
jgi:hypothetical protein